jgi:hypothetical protein
MSERRGNPRLTLAKDEGRLRSLAELLLDASSAVVSRSTGGAQGGDRGAVT